MLLGMVLAPGCTNYDESAAYRGAGGDNPVVDQIFAHRDAAHAPGCALAVARGGKLVYSRGYGYANLDYDIPITPRTVFDVASVTKQFTAALLSMLVLDGKVSLDDDVRKWLPELPEFDTPITLRHMLHHTSGLRDYLNLFPLAGRDDYFPITHEQILDMMSRQRSLVFPPGERYLYSNTAYMLLAIVIERVSGESFGELATSRIFNPVGMQGSRMYENRETVIPRRATGYDTDAGGSSRIVHNYNFDIAGDGQLYTTVEDLLRWDHYLHGEDVAPIRSMMLQEGTLNDGEPIGYALGIVLDSYRGLRTLGHSGSSWGFRSQLVRFIGPALSIAVACNADGARPGLLANRVADYFLADQFAAHAENVETATVQQEADQAKNDLHLNEAQLADFVGGYFSPELDATYRFALRKGALTVRIEQEPPMAMTPVGTNQFEFDFRPRGWSEAQRVELAFVRDERGTISGFELSAGSERGIVFGKLPSAFAVE